MIVDTCTYFREADILELRLCELDPVVDLFVVVEGDHTHAGAPKPSYLPPDLVRRWAHKLHVHTAALPEGDGLVWTWRREIAQRNAIGDVLARLRLAPDDMVLISDCDEIPRRGFVGMLHALPPDGIAVARQMLHYYTFNHSAGPIWQGTRATQYANVVALGADGVRYAGRERGGFPRVFPVADAGWHFSYFGGPEYVKTKVESFLHQELNSPTARDVEAIAARIERGADVYDRPEQTFAIGPAADLPAALTERPGRWVEHFHAPYAPAFHENWMSDDQCMLLARIAQQAPPDGACVEIGAWEGKSTIAIAGALGDRTLIAVDTWAGNIDEGPAHPSVVAALTRDVYAQFRRNLDAYGIGNVQAHHGDWAEWAAHTTFPLAFVHLDAAHDLDTVNAQLDALVPRMVPGGILCGDDYHAPGVRLALTRLDGVESDGKLWYWRMPG